MIKVSVLYPNTAGCKFDMHYYVNQHMPMVQQKLGPACKRMAVEEGNRLRLERDKTAQNSLAPYREMMKSVLAQFLDFAVPAPIYCSWDASISFG